MTKWVLHRQEEQNEQMHGTPCEWFPTAVSLGFSLWFRGTVHPLIVVEVLLM